MDCDKTDKEPPAIAGRSDPSKPTCDGLDRCLGKSKMSLQTPGLLEDSCAQSLVHLGQINKNTKSEHIDANDIYPPRGPTCGL